MTRIFSIILFAIIAFSQAGAAVSAIAAEGDAAYADQRFSDAIALYNKAIDEDGVSADIYYNLGNACYKALTAGQPDGSLSGAIIAYERALRLDPTHEDASANLEFLYAQTVDKQTSENSYSTAFITSIEKCMSANAWAVTTIVLFTVLVVAIVVYFVANNEIVRKIFFFSGLALLLVVAASVTFTMMASKDLKNHDYAVITVEASTLSNSPSVPLTETDRAFMLHEGTKVEILESLQSGEGNEAAIWYKVRVDGEHQAWVSDSDIEVI